MDVDVPMSGDWNGCFSEEIQAITEGGWQPGVNVYMLINYKTQ